MRKYDRREVIRWGAAAGVASCASAAAVEAQPPDPGRQTNVPCDLHIDKHCVKVRIGGNDYTPTTDKCHSIPMTFTKDDVNPEFVWFTLPLNPHAQAKVKAPKNFEKMVFRLKPVTLDGGGIKYHILKLDCELLPGNGKTELGPCCVMCGDMLVCVPPGSSFMCNGVLTECPRNP